MLKLGNYRKRDLDSRLDQVATDGLQQLVQLAELYPFPDFVKNAECDAMRDANCPLAYCADIRAGGQFPCNSPAAALVSYTFFLNKEAAVNKKARDLIRERFNGFFRDWGVQKAAQAIERAHQRLLTQQPTPDDAFGLVRVVDGVKERQYPLRNALETKTAADWFVSNLATLRDVYDRDTRRQWSQRILNKAATQGVKLAAAVDRKLRASAQDGFQLPSVLQQQIAIRPKLAHRVEPEVAQQLRELSQVIADQPRKLLHESLAEKVADVLEEFDRTHGLANKYDETLLPPDEAVFGVSIKEASDLVDNHCATLSGAVYKKSAFASLPFNELREAFGDDVAESVRKGLYVDPEKMAELAVTLPLPDAKLLDALMSRAGVSPVEKHAAVAIYPTREDFATLAVLQS